jgi:hypothetical protein
MIIKGSFHLQPLIHLFPETGKDATGGGIVFQSSPMRVLRINGTAFSILEKCRFGYSLEKIKKKLTINFKKIRFCFLTPYARRKS